MIPQKITPSELQQIKKELADIRRRLTRIPARFAKGGSGGGRTLIKLTCKTELADNTAKSGLIGAYDFTVQTVDTTTGDFVDGTSYSYPDAYAREINYSNANLHGPTNNLVFVEFTTSLDDGSTIWWFDKGLTDEAYEDRDVFTPDFFYCQDESSSSTGP